LAIEKIIKTNKAEFQDYLNSLYKQGLNFAKINNPQEFDKNDEKIEITK
jgi:hypothetical protein